MSDVIVVIDSIIQKSSIVSPASVTVQELMARGFSIVHILNANGVLSLAGKYTPWKLYVDDSDPKHVKVAVSYPEKRPEAILYRIFTWTCNYFRNSKLLLVHSIGDEYEQMLASAIAQELNSRWINTYMTSFLSTQSKCVTICWSDIKWLDRKIMPIQLENGTAPEIDKDLIIVLPPFENEIRNLKKSYRSKKTVLLSMSNADPMESTENWMQYQPQNFIEVFVLTRMASEIIVPPGGSWLFPFDDYEILKDKFTFHDMDWNTGKVTLGELYENVLNGIVCE